MELSFIGTIRISNNEKTIVLDAPVAYKRGINSFNDKQKVVITIDKATNKRTKTQNNYYHFYLSIIEKETGELAYDLHNLFKRKLLPKKFKVVLGQEIEQEPTTTTLDKIEFSDFLDKICAMTGVPIPDPSLAGFISNNKKYY